MPELFVTDKFNPTNIIGPDGIRTVQNIFDNIVSSPDEEVREARVHEPIEFRSVFISDAHMGTLSSCAADMAQFLIHTVNVKYIYLVGDMFEEHLPNRLVTASEGLFLQKLMRHARKGARVVGIPGNHDTFLRKYSGALRAHNFIILDEAAHKTADGKHFLVTHGDQFDTLMRWPRLTILGTRVYELLCRLSVRVNRARQIPWVDRMLTGLGINRDWSLSHHIKAQSDQMAYSTNTNYIRAMTYYLFNRNAEIEKRMTDKENDNNPSSQTAYFDGLIGGHSHIADKKRFFSPVDRQTGKPLGPVEITYFNTGHWTGRPRNATPNGDESWRLRLKNPTCTAVVEHTDGRMTHVQWVPGKGITPLTRYEEQDVAPYDSAGELLATAPPDRHGLVPIKPGRAARIFQKITRALKGRVEASD